MLNSNLPEINDVEGERVPEGLPGVVDAHVHLFPDGIFDAVWRWFDEYGWPIRYRLHSYDLLSFLFAKGIRHVVALQYAHKPGIARQLNAYMAGICRQFPGRVTGMATVFPGEPDCADILNEAFDAGLSGVKLHAHVQCYELSSPEVADILSVCQAAHKPLVMHAGREPKSEAYPCDPYLICHADKLEAVLKKFPRVNICVPHLGFDELDAYNRLIQTYDNLYLDTAMALADYLPADPPMRLSEMRMDRIMYGSDFPNIPYAWDRELKKIGDSGLPEADLRRILHGNAIRFFDIPLSL